MGSFVCQRCGKEFAHYNKSKQEMSRKYCKECSIKVKNHNTKVVSITCVDCGKEFDIEEKKVVQVCRCDKCRKAYRNAYKAQKKREKRELEKKIKEDLEKEINGLGAG